MTTRLHIYRCENPQRARAMCPHHKHLCYGERQDFYDTRRIFFDCGTLVDYGYGYYEPPKLYKKLVIFKDDAGYTVLARYVDKFIIKQVSLSKARRIAKLRLKKDGFIIENFKKEHQNG
jgi:hypothetical protein